MKGNILITGGFGNLGSWITKEFLEAGYEVTVGSSRGLAPKGLEGARCLKFDLMEPSSVADALAGESYDVVVHAGGLNDGFIEGYSWRAYRANVEGTSSLLNSLKKNTPRHVIYLSTFHIYGLSAGFIGEETPPNPQNDYATSHLAAEYVVRQHVAASGIPATILRLSNGYGCPLFVESAKWHLIFFDLIRMASETGKITLKSNPWHRRDFIWMGDIAHATRRLAEQIPQQSEIFNLSLGKSLSLQEFSQEIAAGYVDFYGKDLEVELPNCPDSLDFRLEVRSSKLWERVGMFPRLRVRQEAMHAFRLLASAKHRKQ